VQLNFLNLNTEEPQIISGEMARADFGKGAKIECEQIPEHLMANFEIPSVTCFHRPTKKQIHYLVSKMGVTLIITCLAKREGPSDIKRWCKEEGI
jgi:hypothetical protein